MSVNKNKLQKYSRSLHLDFTDQRLTKSINLRVSKALYDLLSSFAELNEEPLAEYVRYLISWRFMPAVFKSNVLVGKYSPKEIKADIAKYEAGIDEILEDIKDVKNMERWLLNIKAEVADLRKDFDKILSGGIPNRKYTGGPLFREYYRDIKEFNRKRITKKKPKK